MATATTNRSAREVETREHGGFRLGPMMLGVVEDIAMGIEAGESGLKSCSAEGLNAAVAGVGASEINARHHREVQIIEDEDECFNAMGNMLAAGFTFEEVAKRLALGGDETVHLLALERWCDRKRLGCNPDVTPTVWRGSLAHENRRRGHRAMAHLRQTPGGTTHAAVLHVVYGHPDPMLLWASRFRREQKAAPAGNVPKLAEADRVTMNLADELLDMGPEYGPLARYTEAVEEHRLAMAHAYAAQLGVTAAPYVPAHQRPETASPEGAVLIGFKEALAHMGEGAEALRLAARYAPKGAARRDSLSAEEVGPLFDRARHDSRVKWAERVLSSTDALREGLAPPRARLHDEDPETYREEVFVPARDRRATFITAVKVNANKMLTEASLAFRAAWPRR